MNIIYIQAAIEAATGIKKSVDETLNLLYEEGLISEEQKNSYRPFTYANFNDGIKVGGFYHTVNTTKGIDQEVK